ncbi:50S ribosomal protein L10 [Candidatus Pacearchaeota archaeon]|nr:50S ribosomal protein L10 [Candidatus Pacearchaeota archaeon]
MAKKISEKKKRMFKELVELVLNNDTIIISSVKSIPARDFQRIRKKLQDKGEIKAVKKKVMVLSLEKCAEKKPEVKKLEKYVEENCVVLFSNTDPFELASILAENRTPAKAKAGQVAIEDIHISSGPTDFPAGPMISELGSVGLKVAIEGGKITIKDDKILVRKGEKINDNTASILGKLEISPFSIGLEPIAIYSSKDKKIYTGIKIDKEAVENQLKKGASNAFNLAFNMSYACKETISLLIAKANAQFTSLNSQLNV